MSFKVEIELEHDQVDQIIITDLKWHLDHVAEEEYAEALRKVLHYYKGESENEIY